MRCKLTLGKSCKNKPRPTVEQITGSVDCVQSRTDVTIMVSTLLKF